MANSSQCRITCGSIFWQANLTCQKYVHGNARIRFEEVWPSGAQLSELLDCLGDVERQHLSTVYCKLALRCGPVQLLQALLDKKLIALSHTFANGMSLLHVACLASNTKAVSHLISRGISVKIADNRGQTADQLFSCLPDRKGLPMRYPASHKLLKKQPVSFEEKLTIFKLTTVADAFEELQFMLHTLDFDVNRDKDSNGDLLLHLAVQQGIAQLALIMNLVLVHQASVEATNHKGMTPLSIAAHHGHSLLVDVLICLLSADPNAPSLNKWTPVHFAAKKNHVAVIECLARREADLNVEDQFGIRADDIAQRMGNTDCRLVIESLRYQRCQHLSFLARKGNITPSMVRPSDLYNVDSAGLTLVMVAAEANRCDNLMVLLHLQKCPINAQETKHGRTALCLAAVKGKSDAVQTLLRYGAHPAIKDMNGLLPLHYACLHGHILCVQTIVNAPSGLTGLSDAMKHTDDPEICRIIQQACTRRQTEVVNSTLFECAMNGDAERLYCTLEDGDDVNPLTGTGDWPMYMAVGNRYLQVMQILQENGGDCWSQHPTTGSTVLHIACSRGLHDVVHHLLTTSIVTADSSPDQTNPGPSEESTALNINAINYKGHTALQLAATKGYSRIVKLMLSYGATSALIDSEGQLYKCPEYEGVQVLIERHQRSRISHIMSCIKSVKKTNELINMWQAKFDHNLVNRNGDNPLMVACSYGNVQVLQFLLRSAIQSLVEKDHSHESTLTRSQHGGIKECLVDSGAFEESHQACSCARHTSLGTVDEDWSELDTSMTEFSDQDLPSDAAGWIPGKRRASTPKGFSTSLNFQPRQPRHYSYHSDSLDESCEDFSSADTTRQHYSQQVLVQNKRFASSTDLKGRQSTSDLSARDYGSTSHESPMIKSSMGLMQGTGSSVNYLQALNMRDGSCAVHRAVECIQEKKGLACLQLVLQKNPSLTNVTTFDGLTPLHLAAKMGRKRIVKSLIGLDAVNLDIRSASGKLAEDMTHSKRIARCIQTARQNRIQKRSIYRPEACIDPLPTPPPSVGGTSIDFDKLDERFQQLKTSKADW